MSKPNAILYARVSTPKQVEEGYSLDQQIECLRRYAAEHELEVLEEIRDAGYSGATLDRPGMDRIFAVVAGGGVDVVLAQDADRITREPWHFGYLKAEFERYGTKLRALDDGDDETPEGEFFAGIRRGMSKMEREYTKRRTRRGKEKKIRSGKLLGSGPPPYGFRWVQDGKGKRVGFEVDPEAMPVVHRLFELVGAHGMPMYTAAKELERQGFYAPKGGLWRVGVIRNIILNDVYKPHTVEELRALGIAEEIIVALDAAEEYGVSWIYWFPPRLRRGVYRLLGLRVEVFADLTVRVEGEFGANLIRLTPEVERWVEGLREIDARLEERAHADPPKDIQEGIDRIERELAALRRRVCEESATL